MAEKNMTRRDLIRKYNHLIESQVGRAVRPYRADGFVNVVTKYGTDKDSSERYQYLPEPEYPDELFTRFYEGNGLFAKIIDAPAEEAVKHGFTLDGLKDSDLVDFYEEALDELDWEETAMLGIKWARLFGGSIAVMLINDGRGIEEPLDWSNIKSIDDIRVYDRSLIVPDYSSMFQYDPHDPFRTRGSRLGMPETFRVNSRWGAFTVHESRCLTFQNGVLPENASNTLYQMWGMPEYVRISRAIRDAEIAHSSAPKLLQRSIQPVYKMSGLSAELSTEEGEANVLRRLQAIDLARGMLNSMVIDADGEDYDFKTFQFSGVNDVVSISCNMLSAISYLPQTILFGTGVGGLSSTDDTSMENYYNFIERIQKRMLRGNLRYLLSVIFQAGVATGEVDEVPHLNIKFNPLWSISDSEQADLEQKRAQTQQTKAQTVQTYVDMQALDPQEVRKKLADSEEFDVETILDEEDTDDDLFPEGLDYLSEEEKEKAAEFYGATEAEGQQIFENGDFDKYSAGVNVEEHNVDPGTEGSASTAAPAATKMPQDMSEEEKKKAVETNNSDAADTLGGVGVIVVKDGKILAGVRCQGNGEDLICGPGGHIEEGETPEQAAIREAQEEFGITPTSLIYLGNGQEEPDTGITAAVFLCTDFTGEISCEDGEMREPAFLTLDLIERLKPGLFQPFADGVNILLQTLGDAKCLNADGGPGSGNFGHEGVEGKVGGSAPQGSDIGGKAHEPISTRSTPSVKSPAAFDKYVDENGLKPLFRGYAAETDDDVSAISDSIMTGTARVSGEGTSALGSGLYFSDSESEAQSYMARRQNETGFTKGKVTTAALDVDAKVASYGDYEKQKFEEYSQIMESVWDAPQEQQREIGNRAMELYRMSVPEYARSKGVDALYDAATGYTVVVNQKALVVRNDGYSSSTNNKDGFSEKPLDFQPQSDTIKSKYDSSSERHDHGVKGMKWGERKEELSAGERDSLVKYKSSESYKINYALRTGGYDNLDPDQKEMVDSLDSALSKLPTYEGPALRTLLFDKESLDEFLSKHKEGAKVEYPAYSSFSKKAGYNDEANVVLCVRNSTKAKDLSSVDNGEGEILYGRGSRFIVDQVVQKDGKYYIMEEETP